MEYMFGASALVFGLSAGFMAGTWFSDADRWRRKFITAEAKRHALESIRQRQMAPLQFANFQRSAKAQAAKCARDKIKTQERHARMKAAEQRFSLEHLELVP